MEYDFEQHYFSAFGYSGNHHAWCESHVVGQDYRLEIVKNIKDPIVKQFWVQGLPLIAKFATEAVARLNKIRSIYFVRGYSQIVVAQANSSINLREIVDGQDLQLSTFQEVEGWRCSPLKAACCITKMQVAPKWSAVSMPEKRAPRFLSLRG
ncbi:MAG: hypothetical protein IPG80_03510 [Anaerolineales bacterium]|uniref:hypothetical protein n=1 Tax=Candidatus Villigracilis vicinus TaxID=3140679 RepID=UPI0031354279|nr:hypothetical protein [Anaerolineales bacterium]